MPQPLLTILRVAALIYLGLCCAVFLLQRSFLYFPQPRSIDCPTTITLPVKTAQVLVCARPAEGNRALIYFGGNAEDVSLNMPDFSAGLPDRALYLLNYRGYGGSSGKPSQAALFADGLALFDEVYSKHEDIEIVGRSLGSGIAVYVASSRPVARLVLITPYNSIEDLAARQFPYLPVRWLLLDKYQSWKYAPQVSAPTLIIAAENDEIVPRQSTEQFRTHFKSGIVSMVILPRTTHNTISDSFQYISLVKGSL